MRLSNDSETQKAVQKMLCKKCGGVVINSYMRYLASVGYGKRCQCLIERKKTSEKN